MASFFDFSELIGMSSSSGHSDGYAQSRPKVNREQCTCGIPKASDICPGEEDGELLVIDTEKSSREATYLWQSRFACPSCGEQFSSVDALLSHSKTRHPAMCKERSFVSSVIITHKLESTQDGCSTPRTRPPSKGTLSPFSAQSSEHGLSKASTQDTLTEPELPEFFHIGDTPLRNESYACDEDNDDAAHAKYGLADSQLEMFKRLPTPSRFGQGCRAEETLAI